MLRLRHRYPKLFSSIDPTRLLVVMLAPIFVLLVAFTMYPGCDLCRSASVDFVLAKHSRLMPAARKEDAITIAITRDGSVYLGSNRVMPKQLPTPIRLAVSRGAERKVYLSVDRHAKYSDVVVVLDEISTAYIEKIAFLTESPSLANR